MNHPIPPNCHPFVSNRMDLGFTMSPKDLYINASIIESHQKPSFSISELLSYNNVLDVINLKVETQIHVLRDCPHAIQLGNPFPYIRTVTNFFSNWTVSNGVTLISQIKRTSTTTTPNSKSFLHSLFGARLTRNGKISRNESMSIAMICQSHTKSFN